MNKPLEYTNLFKPIQVGKNQLTHRVVLPPLTRNRNDPATQAPTALSIKATFISPQAGGYSLAPGIWSQEQITEWTKPYVSSSATYITPEDEAKAVAAGNPIRGITTAEIKQYVADYAQAARNSVDAGAHGVEIHAASGYLPHQFPELNTNSRTDNYGGSVENRSRFLLEVVDAATAEIGADRLAVRINPWGLFGGMGKSGKQVTEDQFGYLVEQLEARAKEGKELAYLHIIEPRSDESGEYAHDLEKLERHVQDERTLVAPGRYYVSNPDLPDRLANGWPLTKYDRRTFYSTGAEGYIDYPTFKA